MGEPGEWVTFRMPFWRWYVATVVFGQVLYAVLNVLPALFVPGGFGWAYYWATLALGAAVIPAAMAPLILAVVRVFPVRVGPHGLRGSNGWGWPVTMNWASIRRVQSVPVPVVPMARVYSTETRRVLWLATFLNDYPRFAELVARYAGRDHPLTVEVMKHLPDE
jgi:hypothetical protein